MALDLIQCDNTAGLVSTAANQWVSWIRSRPAERSTYSVGLGGGRVFRNFLENTARLLQTNPVGVDRLDFFWGDERCVPPDHAESNFRLARESFLVPLGIDASRIHRLRGEAAPDEAARAAEVVLRVATNSGTAAIPQFDLLFLGMGEDGHVASLFPGATSDVTESPEIFLPVIGPKPPPQRITLSYRAIAAAREVWVIASGEGKQAALAESLRPGGTTPLARVLRERPLTRLFTEIRTGG